MDKFVIKGGNKLKGEVIISGSKNIALPTIISSVISKEILTLSNIPQIKDVENILQILSKMGCKITISDNNFDNLGFYGQEIKIDSSAINIHKIDFEIVRQMRASVVMLGPLLARFGKAKVYMPGGCVIGSRPIDIHIDGLQELGAEIKIEGGFIVANASNGLYGAEINLALPSVGATQNIAMAAVTAKGTTIINNASIEPEVVEPLKLLQMMGARIEGIGTKILTIEGSNGLLENKVSYQIPYDRFEAGTYAMMAIATDGDLTLKRVDGLCHSYLKYLEKAGGGIENISEKCVRIFRNNEKINPLNITTNYYPGYPTDLQAQMMAMLTIADGTSIINETIFENRMMHVPELNRLGAKITVNGNIATINGVEKLTSASVMSSDIRASVALVLAGLIAEGVTEVHRIYHLDRGYEELHNKLKICGAEIERVSA